MRGLGVAAVALCALWTGPAMGQGQGAGGAVEHVLAALEDLRFGVARARLARLLAERPDDTAARRAEVLLAAWDSQQDLRELVASHRARGDATTPAIAHAVLLARSLHRGYPTPWVAQPRLQSLGEDELAGLAEDAVAAAEASGDGPGAAWRLLLASRLAPDTARRMGLLRRALRLAPEQLEVVSAAMRVNLDGQQEVLRDRLERVAERGGPRAGAYLLAAAEGMAGRPGRRQQLLEKVRLYGQARYGDDAEVRLLRGARVRPDERVARLERLWRRGRCSARAAVARELIAAHLTAGSLRPALAVVEAFEESSAELFGSIALEAAAQLQDAGHPAVAYQWFRRGMAGDPRRLTREQLERFAACARAVGAYEESARASELAAERGGLGAVQASVSAVVARALASPLVFVGAAVVMLLTYLAIPLALVALAGWGRRGLTGWPATVGIVGAAAALELALPAGEARLDVWGGLAALLGGAVVVQAGVVLSRGTGLAPGRELRALRKRLVGRAVPWLIYWVRLVAVVLAMVGLTAGLALLLRPAVSPLVAEAARVSPDTDAARLLDAGRAPFGAALIALRAALREEILCRLFFLPLLVRAWRGWALGRPAAVLAIAALWALGHVGVATPESFKLLQVFGVGVLLGWLALRQGALSALLAHAAFNLASVALQAAQGAS